MLIKVLASLTNWWLWVQQESLFTPFKRGSNQKQRLSTLSSQGKVKGKELCKCMQLLHSLQKHLGCNCS